MVDSQHDRRPARLGRLLRRAQRRAFFARKRGHARAEREGFRAFLSGARWRWLVEGGGGGRGDQPLDLAAGVREPVVRDARVVVEDRAA
eukprot:6172361-Pleurochrysis_carterae.AAC.2